MKFDCIEDYDIFDDSIIFWVQISEVPSDIQNKAKLIDKENYEISCFGICVDYDREEKKFQIVADVNMNNVYYVNNNGDKFWYKIDLEDDFVRKIYQECKKELKGRCLE